MSTNRIIRANIYWNFRHFSLSIHLTFENIRWTLRSFHCSCYNITPATVRPCIMLLRLTLFQFYALVLGFPLIVYCIHNCCMQMERPCTNQKRCPMYLFQRSFVSLFGIKIPTVFSEVEMYLHTYVRVKLSRLTLFRLALELIETYLLR